MRKVGGWEGSRENGRTEGQGETRFRRQLTPVELWEARSGVWENSLDCFKRENRERKVPLSGPSEAGRGGRGRRAGKGPAFHGRGEEGRHRPVGSDTLPNPLDTPPSDPRPEERVQPQQTAETHGLCAGGGAAPRRAWYGGRAGSCPGQSLGAGGGGELP